MDKIYTTTLSQLGHAIACSHNNHEYFAQKIHLQNKTNKSLINNSLKQKEQSSQCPTSVSQCPTSVSQCPTNDSQCPTNVLQCPTNVSQCPTNVSQCPTSISHQTKRVSKGIDKILLAIKTAFKFVVKNVSVYTLKSLNILRTSNNIYPKIQPVINHFGIIGKKLSVFIKYRGAKFKFCFH